MEGKNSTFPELSKIWGYPLRATVGVPAVRRALEKCTPNSGTGVFTSQKKRSLRARITMKRKAA